MTAGSIDPYIDLKNEDTIYVSNFPHGKYISKTFKSKDRVDQDVFKVSPRIQVRLTYIKDNDELCGIKINKTGNRPQELSLSKYDFKMLLATLDYFSELDFKSIANGTLVLNTNITKENQDKIRQFLTTLVSDPKTNEILKTLPNITPSYLQEISRRKQSINLFETILNNKEEFNKLKEKCKIEKNEEVWQRLFTRNDWILGPNIQRLTDDRTLDEHDIADIPYISVDGFLDIIELKLPTEQFWNTDGSINNKLAKAIMQCARYLRVAEKKANDLDKSKELGCEIVKPRITLVYGRSNDWSDEQKENFRLLNSSLSNISVLSYDHVLLRAKKNNTRTIKNENDIL